MYATNVVTCSTETITLVDPLRAYKRCNFSLWSDINLKHRICPNSVRIVNIHKYFSCSNPEWSWRQHLWGWIVLRYKFFMNHNYCWMETVMSKWLSCLCINILLNQTHVLFTASCGDKYFFCMYFLFLYVAYIETLPCRRDTFVTYEKRISCVTQTD